MTQYQYFGASLSIFLLVCGRTRVWTLQSTFIKCTNFVQIWLYENSKVISNTGVENIGDNYNNADLGLGGADAGGQGANGGQNHDQNHDQNHGQNHDQNHY